MRMTRDDDDDDYPQQKQQQKKILCSERVNGSKVSVRLSYEQPRGGRTTTTPTTPTHVDEPTTTEPSQ